MLSANLLRRKRRLFSAATPFGKPFKHTKPMTFEIAFASGCQPEENAKNIMFPPGMANIYELFIVQSRSLTVLQEAD